MLTGEMVLVLTHLMHSTPLGTNTEARWLGLNGVSIVMVRLFSDKWMVILAMLPLVGGEDDGDIH